MALSQHIDLPSADPKLTIDGKIYSPKAWRDEEAKGVLNPTDPDVRFSRGSDQTETPKFKNWYGDWQNAGNETQGNEGNDRGVAGESAGGSTMDSGRSGPLDSQGRPVRLYHGTNDDFTTFEVGHKNSYDHGWLGRGIYLTDSSELADSYANLKGGYEGQVIMPVYAAIKNPYHATLETKKRVKNGGIGASELFTQRLKDAGYDGVVLTYPDGIREFVAFEPTQVKSATGNNGNFDRTNPDIRFSRGPVAAARDTLAAARELNLAAGYKLGDFRCHHPVLKLKVRYGEN